MIKLALPQEKYKETFITGVLEMKELLGHNIAEYKILNIDFLKNHFPAYIQKKANNIQGINLKEGFVPDTTFWVIDKEEKYVGRITFRHYLNDFLEKVGGHIGYNIITSERRKGYASEALRLCLIEAKKFGLTKVLLVCLEGNIASKKTIEKNGGIFEKIFQKDGVTYLHYWIDLS